jgi:hypothetical protein
MIHTLTAILEHSFGVTTIMDYMVACTLMICAATVFVAVMRKR